MYDAAALREVERHLHIRRGVSPNRAVRGKTDDERGIPQKRQRENGKRQKTRVLQSPISSLQSLLSNLQSLYRVQRRFNHRCFACRLYRAFHIF